MPIEVPPHADNLTALDTADGSSHSPGVGTGVTLTTGHTYVFVLGGERLVGAAPLGSAQIQWDAAAALTITVEVCNFASVTGRPDATGPADVKDWDISAKGAWMKVDPSTAYVTVADTTAGTGGATVANATVTVAGGTAGGAYYDLGNLGARRARIKVVATTGGVVRCGMYAKAVG